MDYKQIHPNGSPFSWQELSEQNRLSNSTKDNNRNAMKFINMLISLFK